MGFGEAEKEEDSGEGVLSRALKKLLSRERKLETKEDERGSQGTQDRWKEGKDIQDKAITSKERKVRSQEL